MSLALFAAIAALIVIFAVATTLAFAVYMHFFMKSIMDMQVEMVKRLTEDDEDVDDYFAGTPDPQYFLPHQV